MSLGQVTIIVPNYKTAELTRLCLRLIRKHTDPAKVKIIVVDNDSQDDSLQYLRQLSWIKLIERKPETNESPVLSHSRALDLALDQVTTPYVLSIHTDTFVKHPKWLEFLLTQIERRPTIAGVGSWKLETKPFWRRSLKLFERYAQMIYYRLNGIEKHAIEGVGKNYYYLRSHCALYRTAILRQMKLHFSDEGMVAGKSMHRALCKAGYEMVFLPSDVLIKYLDHVNHATTVLNPKLTKRISTVDKGLRRIEKSLASVKADEILLDVNLDV